MTYPWCRRSLCALLSAFPRNNGRKRGIKPYTICCNTVFAGFENLLKEIDSKNLKPNVRNYSKTMAPLCAQGKTSEAEELLDARKEENMESAHFTFDETDLASEERLWALYDRWQRHHGVTRSADEKRQRLDVFRANANYILEANKEGRGYLLGLNMFGDMTEEEVQSNYMGLDLDWYRIHADEDGAGDGKFTQR